MKMDSGLPTGPTDLSKLRYENKQVHEPERSVADALMGRALAVQSSALPSHVLGHVVVVCALWLWRDDGNFENSRTRKGLTDDTKYFADVEGRCWAHSKFPMEAAWQRSAGQCFAWDNLRDVKLRHVLGTVVTPVDGTTGICPRKT